VYGVEFGVACLKGFRVDAFYMKTNNGPKVSILTVGPHQNISLNILTTITNITVPPFCYETAPQFGDTLHQFLYSSQQHTFRGIPYYEKEKETSQT